MYIPSFFGEILHKRRNSIILARKTPICRQVKIFDFDEIRNFATLILKYLRNNVFPPLLHLLEKK